MDALQEHRHEPEAEGDWRPVGSENELRRRRTAVVEGPAGAVAVFWNDGSPCALANTCVHRKRELSRGTIFQGRVICPGHQWAFDLETGYCMERERTQPLFRVVSRGDTIYVDVSAPINADAVAAEAAAAGDDDPAGNGGDAS